MDPETATASAIHQSETGVRIGETTYSGFTGSPVVVALGKAACAMARGVADSVGTVRGIAVSDHREPSPVEVVVGGHPIPDGRSHAAGMRLLNAVESIQPSDLVVFCISGGGSALAEVPTPGIGMDALAALNDGLISGGFPIEVINEVRAAVSLIKGGRLRLASRSEQVVTLVLSDVVGAGPETVASGPTLGFGLGSVPKWVMADLVATGAVTPAVASAVEGSTPVASPGELSYVVIGSPTAAAEWALHACGLRGLEARTWTSELSGDVESAVRGVLDQLPTGSDTGQVVVATGEVTIRTSGSGLGGRNQHAALLAAKLIAGTDMVFAAFGTDGRDGPTDAAGAVVDGGSVDRMASNGVNIDDAIRTFNSYHALSASGDLVITGPSGTNVADLWMVCRST